MAILKNITETSVDIRTLLERTEYLIDPAKTRKGYIGAIGCSPDNFPKISEALKGISHRKNHKMVRHFVVGFSPCDEDKSKDDFMKAARETAKFFEDCYILYALHTNTSHTHFHILLCNTRISDGHQISVSDSDLARFKEHCSSVLRKYGMNPIEKLDTTDDGNPLEINEILYPSELTQEQKVKTLYEGVDTSNRGGYYGSHQYIPMNYTVNVFLPPETQGTVFQGKYGTPCLSFRPSFPPFPRQTISTPTLLPNTPQILPPEQPFPLNNDYVLSNNEYCPQDERHDDDRLIDDYDYAFLDDEYYPQDDEYDDEPLWVSRTEETHEEAKTDNSDDFNADNKRVNPFIEIHEKSKTDNSDDSPETDNTRVNPFIILEE